MCSILVLVLFLREKRATLKPGEAEQPVATEAKKSPPQAKRPCIRTWHALLNVTAISTIFALGNSSDAFHLPEDGRS